MNEKNGGSVSQLSDDSTTIFGMSLRDYFAAKAIQGLLSNPGGPIQSNEINGWGYTNVTEEIVALTAYEMADHMLAARGVKS